jgi:hypothetical protein
MTRNLVLGCLLLAGWRAEATECGAARLEVLHWRGATSAKDAAGKLRAAEKKVASACAPKTVTISALPLGYLSVPPGNLSKATLDIPEESGLTLTTRAGAASGIVFAEAAKLTTPAVHVESTLSPDRQLGEALVVVALGAELTVEEPAPGKGSWHITVDKPPVTLPLSKLRACAAGRDKSIKVTAAACKELLAVVDILPSPSALPERGRARLLGEWQWGWHAGFDLGPDELQAPPRTAPRPAVPMTLELSAPLTGISDGKLLHVNIEDNARDKVAGLAMKIGHGCGDDDEKCETQRFVAEIWFDDAFGVPVLRAPQTPPSPGALTGKVADRLARPLVGQRVQCTSTRGVSVTITDNEGNFRFDGLAGGDAVVVPVGKLPGTIAKGDEKRSIKVAGGETKVPIIYENRILE